MRISLQFWYQIGQIQQNTGHWHWFLKVDCQFSRIHQALVWRCCGAVVLRGRGLLSRPPADTANTQLRRTGEWWGDGDQWRAHPCTQSPGPATVNTAHTSLTVIQLIIKQSVSLKIAAMKNKSRAAHTEYTTQTDWGIWQTQRKS